MTINGITNYQYQNSGENKYAQMGSSKSYYWEKSGSRYSPIENTLGNKGCLFVAEINIGNTEKIKKFAPTNIQVAIHPAANYSGNDKYFVAKEYKKQILTDSGSVKLVGTYMPMAKSNSMSMLLKDISDSDFVVERVWDQKKSQELINKWAKSEDFSAYIIAEVSVEGGGSHFINITGYNEDKKGNMILVIMIRQSGRSLPYIPSMM